MHIIIPFNFLAYITVVGKDIRWGKVKVSENHSEVVISASQDSMSLHLLPFYYIQFLKVIEMFELFWNDFCVVFITLAKGYYSIIKGRKDIWLYWGWICVLFWSAHSYSVIFHYDFTLIRAAQKKTTLYASKCFLFYIDSISL